MAPGGPHQELQWAILEAFLHSPSLEPVLDNRRNTSPVTLITDIKEGLVCRGGDVITILTGTSRALDRGCGI